VLFDRVGDGQHLARVRAVADHEVVGEIAETPEVENQDFFRLLIQGGFDDVLQDGFQLRTSSV
jgi:hypothetical protein